MAEASKESTVIRDGKAISVHPNSLVVGDIVEINGGDEIPADAILIKGNSVMCDEAAMTGESDILHKDDFQSCVDCRTNIMQ